MSEITIEDFDNWKQNKVTKVVMATIAETAEEYKEAILDGSISRNSTEEFVRRYNYNLGVLDGLKFQMNIQFSSEEQEEENSDGY